MTKFLFIFLISLCGVTASASDLTGLLNSTGDLVILVVDRPSTPPYDAALLWTAVVGNDSNKKLKTPTFSLVCSTTLSQPLNQRFGSCRTSISKEKLLHENGYYSAVLSDPEIMSNTEDVDLKLHGGKLQIVFDHARKTFLIKIEDSLVRQLYPY